VTTGRLIDGLRVIRSGIDGSEKIVVRGLQRVRPGASVTPHMIDLETATSSPAPTTPVESAPAISPDSDGNR
jgi:multidrug efflux system membrane fusion protein